MPATTKQKNNFAKSATFHLKAVAKAAEKLSKNAGKKKKPVTKKAAVKKTAKGGSKSK